MTLKKLWFLHGFATKSQKQRRQMIQYNSIQYQIINGSNRKQHQEGSTCQRLKINPFNTVQNQVPIAFKGYSFNLKDIRNIPCSSCGRTMTTQLELEQLKRKFKSAKKSELATLLSKYKTRFSPEKKFIVAKIRDYSRTYKNFDILRLTEQLAHNFSSKKNNLPIGQKTKDWLARISQAQNMNRCVSELFNPTIISVDHIRARSSSIMNDMENYLLMCQECNNKKGSRFLAVYIANNPEMIGNLKLYISNIIKLTQKKDKDNTYSKEYLCKLVQEYIPALCNTLMRELKPFVSQDVLDELMTYLTTSQSQIARKTIEKKIQTQLTASSSKLERLEELCKQKRYKENKRRL